MILKFTWSNKHIGIVSEMNTLSSKKKKRFEKENLVCQIKKYIIKVYGLKQFNACAEIEQSNKAKETPEEYKDYKYHQHEISLWQ